MTPRILYQENRVHPHAAKPSHSRSPEAFLGAVSGKGLVKRFLGRLQDCIGVFVTQAQGRQHGKTHRLKRQRPSKGFSIGRFKLSKTDFDLVHLQHLLLCLLMTVLSAAAVAAYPLIERQVPMPSVHADSYEKLKIRYRPLFLACQATLREWPGGSSEIWRMLDRHVESTWGQFNPSSYGAGPSLLTFLDTLEYTRSRRMAHALGEISGHLTRCAPTASAYAVTRSKATDILGAAMRRILYNLSDYADARQSLADRQRMQADLLRLIDAAEVLLRRLAP